MKKMIIALGLVGGMIMAIMAAESRAANPANNNAELLAIATIAKFEGFSAKPYKCPGGKMTIGYGFTDPDLVKKGTITRQEADRELGKRVRKELAFIRSHIQGLTPRQEAAVVSFVYNVGHQAFLDSTFLKKLKASDMTAAKAEIQKWVYAKGKKLNGLIKRRAAEAKLLA